ncbi:MAG: mechanosensitive ion channel, partial [Muribaculaceae bacterium]|nr:mechanosensitive ion channel [Muribaculaceae bacterium]
WRLFHRRRKALAAKIESLSEEHRSRIENYNPRVKRHPVVVLDQMADSSINLKVRAWTRTTDYWTVYYEMNETFYNELPKAGLSFPFPQMDVHVNQVSSES